MAGTNSADTVDIDIDPAVFQEFADLEKQFAKVELDALRRKEFALKPLYSKRTALTSKIPEFWPSVLLHGPEEFQNSLGELDGDTINAVKSLHIERYEVNSETEGEPRSLRFTFEWNDNEWFEDKRTVKEFKFVQRDEDGAGAFVSVPVSFAWKKKGKKMNAGLLDLAVDLYSAEEALGLKNQQTGEMLKVVDRESLWQYEKLRTRLEALEDDTETQPSWLEWFGFRGAVGEPVMKRTMEQDADDEDEADEEDDSRMLDVEIYPGGEEITIALAEDLWPNVMDYFMASQQDDPLDGFDPEDMTGDEEEDEEDGDAPELVEVEELRPAKRQRNT